VDLRRCAIRIALATLCVSVATCRTTTEVVAPCMDPVLLSVSAGTTPRFTWDPACGAFQLIVQDTANTGFWAVTSDSSRLRSGIDYGVTPASDAQQLMAPVALQHGTPYVVGLFRNFYGPTPAPADNIAAIKFTP
jgi:hypothetical protein